MTARARVVAATAAAAALAAGVVVAVVSAQSEGDRGAAPPQTAATPRPGNPPLALELALRTDAEAADLRRGQQLVNEGKEHEALPYFARHGSLEARVGEAFARWPDGTVERMTQLGGLYQRSAMVQLHLGLARFWAGQAGAEEAWREALDVEPDTPYAVRAGDLLHPSFAPGLPVFVPSFDPPRSLGSLDPADQLVALEGAAQNGGVRDLLLYGVGLQRAGRPVSAATAYDRAAAAAPGSAEAQVAAAVGRFDKARPAEAFSRLGPLTRRFPHASTVRFHLGLLLLWSGQIEEAKRQLRKAETAEPGSPLAREAARYLTRVEAAQR